jgi:transposase
LCQVVSNEVCCKIKQEESCQQIELKLGQHLIRAYQLPTEVGRVDTSSFSVHHEQIESEADSLLRYGHFLDHRPDLLQYRQLLGTLDPAGVPLVSTTLAGNGADDPLYYPTWQRMTQVIGHKQFVFLADCKAAAIATRAQIAAKGGIYCFPLPMSGQNPLLLIQWVLDPPAASVEIRLPGQEVRTFLLMLSFLEDGTFVPLTPKDIARILNTHPESVSLLCAHSLNEG